MRCNQILPPSQPTIDDDDGAGGIRMIIVRVATMRMVMVVI